MRSTHTSLLFAVLPTDVINSEIHCRNNAVFNARGVVVLNVVVESTDVVVSSTVVVAPIVVVGSAVVCSVVVATPDIVASLVVVITTLASHNDVIR